MKLVNFVLDNNGISLNWQGHNLDLHNNYEFKSLCYELPLRQAELVWQRSLAPWAANAVVSGLKLVFKNVSFFVVKERDAAYPVTEDDCLMSLSFHSVELRDEFDSISIAFSPTDDLTFFFQSEWGIKLNAGIAELIVLD